MIRAFHDDKAARLQRDEDLREFLAKRMNYVTIAGVILAALNIIAIIAHK